MNCVGPTVYLMRPDDANRKANALFQPIAKKLSARLTPADATGVNESS
jgi:hypothetical protein